MGIFLKYYQAVRRNGNNIVISFINAYHLTKQLLNDENKMDYLVILAMHLNNEVIVTKNRKMFLREIYGNGTVGCSLYSESINETLKRFPANSIKLTNYKILNQ